ncbi:MAG: leucine-rich repeat protein [Lachnospiraceae bacterium]|nr:leucine-rich repeat protein [Lachnospiraceae bacterium]
MRNASPMRKVLSYGVCFVLFAEMMFSNMASADELPDGDIIKPPSHWSNPTTSASESSSDYELTSTSEDIVTTPSSWNEESSQAGTSEESSQVTTSEVSSEIVTSINGNSDSNPVVNRNKKAKNGEVFFNSKYKAKFQIISVKKKTVAYKLSTNKTRTNATIPNTIRYKNTTFKVVTISSKAFMNHKKLKKLTVGTNVKTINSYAFKKCKKLKKITIKSKKLSSVNKKAFASANKKVVIKVPSKKLKSYKKKFKKCGISSKTVIKL